MESKHLVFLALFLVIIAITILVPKSQYWCLLALVVLVVIYFMTSKKFGKTLYNRQEENEEVALIKTNG